MSGKTKWIEEWIKEKEGSIENFRKHQSLYCKYEKMLDGIGGKILRWDKNGMSFANELKTHHEALKLCGHESAPSDIHMEELAAISWAMCLLADLATYQGDE